MHDADKSADSGHRAERTKRLRWAIVTSLMVRPLAVLIPLLVVPIFIRYLGVERYGIFETISAFAVWIGLANFGLGFGLRNRLMDCHVSGDRDLARKYVSTLFWFMSALASVGLVAIVAVVYTVPWESVFGVQGSISLAELRYAVLLALVIPLFGMSISYAPSIYTAFQEIHRQNFWDGLAKVATISACVALPLTGLGIGGAILALAGVPVIVALVNELWLWFRAKPWLRPRLKSFDRALLSKLARDGVLLFILQSASIMMFQADRIIIGVLRGPLEVAEFSIANRAMMLAYGAFALVLMPLWPAYGEAFRRGDVAWCVRKLQQTLLVGFACIGLAGAGFLLFRVPVFTLLGGTEQLIPSQPLLLGMVVGCLCRVWSDSHSIVLNGANILVPQVILLGANAIAAVVLNIIGTHFFGNVGAVWSFPVAAVLTTVWGYPLLVKRFVSRGRKIQVVSADG